MSRNRRCFLTGLGIGLVLAVAAIPLTLAVDEALMTWTERHAE